MLIWSAIRCSQILLALIGDPLGAWFAMLPWLRGCYGDPEGALSFAYGATPTSARARRHGYIPNDIYSIFCLCKDLTVIIYGFGLLAKIIIIKTILGVQLSNVLKELIVYSCIFKTIIRSALNIEKCPYCVGSMLILHPYMHLDK